MTLLQQNIRYLYQHFDGKQEVLAKLLNIKQNTLSTYINNHEPPIDKIQKIADWYNISLDDLVNKDLKNEYSFPHSIDLDKIIDVGNNILHFFESDTANQNENFKKAQKIVEETFNSTDFSSIRGKISVLKHAVFLYQKAWDENHTYVALSNAISTVFTIYQSYNQLNDIFSQKI